MVAHPFQEKSVGCATLSDEIRLSAKFSSSSFVFGLFCEVRAAPQYSLQANVTPGSNDARPMGGASTKAADRARVSSR
jgi:hypothetical protein